ncbi:MAG: hypothetical protein ABIQ93_08135 [Saprospiraceae bacterium]
MRVAFLSFLLLFLLSACTSPQDRLQAIESEMVDLLGPAADLNVPVQNAPFQLPLPPPLAVQAEQKSRAQKLLADAARIDSLALAPAERRQLRQYRQVLADLSGERSGWPLDPLGYTLNEPLQRCLVEPGGESLAVLLEKIPDYYTEVELRWGHPNPRNLDPAVAQCLAALDQLEQLEEDLGKYPLAVQARLQMALPPARAAIKNYLGQCRSGVLE